MKECVSEGVCEQVRLCVCASMSVCTAYIALPISVCHPPYDSLLALLGTFLALLLFWRELQAPHSSRGEKSKQRQCEFPHPPNRCCVSKQAQAVMMAVQESKRQQGTCRGRANCAASVTVVSSSFCVEPACGRLISCGGSWPRF